MKIKKSFALKLSMYLITVFLVIFIGVLSYNYYVSKESIMNGIQSLASESCHAVLGKIEIELRAAQQIAEDAVSVVENLPMDQAQLEAFLGNVVEKNHEIFGCAVNYEPYQFIKTDKYFEVYAYKPGGKKVEFQPQGNYEEYDYFNKDYYKNPIKAGKGVWSEPYYDEGGGNIKMVTYSLPFYKVADGKRTVNGVIAVDISLQWLMDYIHSIKVSKTGYTFMLSNKGYFMEHTDPKRILTATMGDMAESEHNPKLVEVAKLMTSGESGFIEHYSSYLKQQCYISFGPLTLTGWSIGIVVPKSEMLSTLYNVTLKLFLIGLIGYLIAFFLVIFLSYRMTAPLKSLVKATYKIGKGDFISPIPIVRTSDEIGVLSDSFIKMQSNLVKYVNDLQKTTSEKERIEKELSIGKEIQQSILPKSFPVSDEFELYAKLIPARHVAGDLYDFFALGENKICVAVGDVSGKGVPAALFMTIAKTLIRAKTVPEKSLSEALQEINIAMCKESTLSMFVTLIICIVDLRTGSVEMCNAGHNPPIIIPKESAPVKLEYPEKYPPIGLFDETIYESVTFELKPEDRLIIYTDGITEAMSKDMEQFSDEKFIEKLDECKNLKTKDIVESIINEVALYAGEAEQSDDITLLALQYKKEKVSSAEAG